MPKAKISSKEKTLNNKSIKDVKKKVSDVEVYGNGDLFQLISKASSKKEGWMKSTKAMETGNGVVVQVTTQQRNKDGSYSVAEALTTVPDSIIEEQFAGEDMTKLTGRKIVQLKEEK